MRIKIVRRLAREASQESTETEVYDIYHDVGLFSPLFSKWMIDKSSLDRDEALAYIGRYALDTTPVSILKMEY